MAFVCFVYMIWPVLDASIVRLLNVFSSYGSNIV